MVLRVTSLAPMALLLRSPQIQGVGFEEQEGGPSCVELYSAKPV